jgi:gluconate/galactonate dehydratase
MTANYEDTLSHVNTYSKPSELRITDMRIGMLQRRPMIKLYTNQGLRCATEAARPTH